METTATAVDTPTYKLGIEQGMRLLKAFATETPFTAGRRPFFRYRDLGLEAVTNGRMRANHTSSIAGMLESTGWHYHTCEMQFVFIMRGIVVIEFEDGTEAAFGQSDAFFIPGGVRHNEIYVSEDKESLELSVPGKLGTVNVERPAGLPEKLRPVGVAWRDGIGGRGT